MKDAGYIQTYTEERAQDDAEKGVFPDSQRILERLQQDGLLEHTTEAERIRIAEIYAARYMLISAAMKLPHRTEPLVTVAAWSRDERLQITLKDEARMELERRAGGLTDAIAGVLNESPSALTLATLERPANVEALAQQYPAVRKYYASEDGEEVRSCAADELRAALEDV